MQNQMNSSSFFRGGFGEEIERGSNFRGTIERNSIEREIGPETHSELILIIIRPCSPYVDILERNEILSQ